MQAIIAIQSVTHAAIYLHVLYFFWMHEISFYITYLFVCMILLSGQVPIFHSPYMLMS